EDCAGGRRLRVEAAARAMAHGEGRPRPEPLRCAPGGQVEERVASHQKEEARPRPLTGQRLEGVDGGGGARPAHLDVGDGEGRMAGDGEGGQRVRAERGGDPARRLVRRRPRRDEDHPIEREPFAERLGQEQVSEVDGVERPAEDADARLRHATAGQPSAGYSRIWPEPSTTNFVVVSSSTPTGPRAWSFDVEIPSSAPMPNWLPSQSRVDALTRTQAASPSARRRRAGA